MWYVLYQVAIKRRIFAARLPAVPAMPTMHHI